MNIHDIVNQVLHLQNNSNIVLLGDSAVGKTSLISRFDAGLFGEDYNPTIGKKVTEKEITMDIGGKEQQMNFMVWDIIGQKGYKYSQTTSFYNAKGAIMVCDLTRKETLASLMSYWIPLVLRVIGPVPMIFLGNKSDLEDECLYGLQEIEMMAGSCKAFGIGRNAHIVSAKTGENVEEAFEDLAKLLMTNYVPVKLGVDLRLMDKAEINSVKDALDHIMADFADQFGKMEYATPFLQHQLTISRVDLDDPDRESVTRFIDNLAMAEGLYKEAFKSEENQKKRHMVLKHARD